MSKEKQIHPPIPATPAPLLVIEYQGQLVADSRDVAELMERNHGNLVRSIHTYCGYLSEIKIDSAKFFIPSTYMDEQGKPRLHYLLTEMGCEFVANKATGKKGAVFTARYVEAFHAMREELTRRRELRIIGKPIRRSLTDALRDSGEVERMKGHAYATFTNLAYKLTTGKSARQLRQEHGADQKANAADLLTSAELEVYQRKEAAIAVLLDAGMRYDAIKAALAGEER